jgi:hypothetical protein
MPNDELFSGIPSLDDEAGMQSFLNNDALANLGLGTDPTPAALQQNVTNPAPATPATPVANPIAGDSAANAPQYSAEQVANIISRIQAQSQTQAAATSQAQPQASAYTPRQAEIIKQLIDKGVPMERISAALHGQRESNAQQVAIMQRLAQMEQYLQAQQYQQAQNEFVDKMTAFGDKFGLSENDLVTFGNKAMSMGINLTQVSDVEAVFRAVYPDQYAIRTQRMSNTSAPQLYGGSSTPEAPRAMAAKMEDAYVDQFLRASMPNQYGMFTKK